MPRRTILSSIQTGATVAQTLQSLDGANAAGKPLKVTVHPFAAPYLDHTIAGFVDGPPTSSVVAVLSGERPSGGTWRRLTLARVGPWHYEVEAFPTEFGDALAPLAPGIPPGPTRRGHH